MFLDAFTRLLETHCPPAVVRAALADPSAADPLRAAIAESGFLDCLVPESEGGAGLTLTEFAPLVMAAGNFLLPVPFAETAVTRSTGQPLTTDAAVALAAARTAGTCQRVLQMTIDHVTTRSQFGRPLSAFQAIQHQVAVMAEEVAAATLAATIGLRGPAIAPEPAAIARIRCAEAAETVAALAHQTHGATGATAEHDLHLWTTELRQLQRCHGPTSDWATRLGAARAAQAHGATGLSRPGG